MKFGFIGDTHFTNRAPERRKDDFLDAGLCKLAQAMGWFQDRGCTAVFQAGDFFNSSTAANRVKREIILLLAKFDIPVYTIYGQHDISGHSASTYYNSPLGVLESAGAIQLLGEDPHTISRETKCIDAYGASFGQDVPTPLDPAAYNILVVHDMIGDRPLWPGQPLQSPRVYLRSHPHYRIILCGDYHYSFVDRLGKDQLILNCGVLMRKSLTDIKLGHEPSVCVVDIDTLEVETLKLEVAPIEEIFDTTQIKARDSESLNAFAANLLKSREDNKQVAWKQILLDVIVDKGVSAPAQAHINESMEKACLIKGE